MFKEKFIFDATDGKAIGTHKLGVLPKTAVITKAWIHVLTTFTSATDAGTIALGYDGTVGAFDAATAISSGTTWDNAAPRVSDAAADGAVANFVEIGATDVKVIATVAVEALTAGKLLLFVEYYIGD